MQWSVRKKTSYKITRNSASGELARESVPLSEVNAEGEMGERKG